MTIQIFGEILEGIAKSKKYVKLDLTDNITESETMFDIRILDAKNHKIGKSFITAIALPDTVKIIPDLTDDCGFFNGFSNLKTFNSNNLVIIGNWAFEDCTSLANITIPDSVTNIGKNAFSGCTSIIGIVCEPINPPTLQNSNVFRGSSADLQIKVPAESIDAYKTATNWSTYADKITAID